MNKKPLSERDICTKYITPALVEAGWDLDTQIREEVSFTDGRIYVRGKLHTRGAKKRVDYILYCKPNIPLAIIEAKDNNHTVGAGRVLVSRFSIAFAPSAEPLQPCKVSHFRHALYVRKSVKLHSLGNDRASGFEVPRQKKAHRSGWLYRSSPP